MPRKTDGERCSGSDEPTADNAEHTRNAEYRRITSPGTVGKRCTHGYHKGDISGGKGSFKEVPKAMSRPANTRLTEARTKSKAAPSAMMASSFWKRVFIHRLLLSGIVLDIPLARVMLKRTSVRAIRVLRSSLHRHPDGQGPRKF